MKKKFLLCCEAIIVALLIIYIIMSVSEKKKNNDYISGIISGGYISLTDLYDTDTTNLFDFFDDNNSEKIMLNTIEKLKKESNYYFWGEQDLYVDNLFFDKLNRESDFVYGQNEVQEEQEEQIPLKAIQLDYGQLGIVPDKNEGIPVILGSQYSKYLNEGDEFSGNIYGNLKCKFYAKEICDVQSKLEKTIVSILCDLLEEDNLNNYIIMPFIDSTYFPINGDKSYKIYLSDKCEGFFSVSSVSEYERTLNSINKISNDTGFKYDLEYYPSYKERLIEIKEITIIVILLSVMIEFYIVYKMLGGKYAEK